ncbi:MAG: cytochrome-c peroxidase, partial [Desulfuromonadaceae bacterium]
PLNPVEMAMLDKDSVIAVLEGDTEIASLFTSVFGDDAFVDVDAAYDNFGRAVAAYERSAEVTQFTSAFDEKFNDNREGQTMSVGEQLFRQNCTTCHAMGRHGGGYPLFTNHKYVNAGVPENFLISDPNDPSDNDLGLGPVVDDPAQNGKFKVPTLRNIELTAPYSHNGYFATLEEMVSFMNDNSGYTPEVSENLSTEVGNLGLTEEECAEIVSFLKTLTDK